MLVWRARVRTGLRAGCCAAGLAAGGWLPAPGPGWERGAAPPALGAGRAERGPDVSAGGFVRPQRGPEPGSGRAWVTRTAGGFLWDFQGIYRFNWFVLLLLRK